MTSQKGWAAIPQNYRTQFDDDFVAYQAFEGWQNLSGEQREMFFIGDDYLPLPMAHAERIRVLFGGAARVFVREALSGASGDSRGSIAKFTEEDTAIIADAWNDKRKIQRVREWLHSKGPAYSTPVYLLYDHLVVATEWKIVVRYWDAFAWPVGVEMLALDSSRSWICRFHHEDTITFSTYKQHSGSSAEPS